MVGVVLGTVIIPEAWGLLKPHLFPPKVRHDSDGAELLNEILVKSQRARELINKGLLTTPIRYEMHLTEVGIIERRLLRQIADELHDHLRNGDITAWGTPDNKKPYQKIEPHEWSEIELTADVQDVSTLPHQLHAVYRKARGTTVFAYVWIKFNRKQFLKEYPLTLFPRKKGEGPHEKRHLEAAV